MGVSAGPDLIQDGLVYSVDASDKNSYPGSGTSWNDLVHEEHFPIQWNHVSCHPQG